MNYRRVTVSLPKNLYEDLLTMFGKGKISGVLAEAAERRILEKKLEPKDPIKAFFALRKITSKLTHEEIMDAIHKGRT
ncbi:MAG: hypothetical protein US60_C0014G0002 [Microgenomates group bacterium GW2011_GWC1_37_8]|uniref:Uncharacterized protein n=1 Tax=Candidatus Woesebacteria bacterium GW2011_GWB1_38_8 TaxID=1618570 RepID=A0A0G0L956_9BACT|nr:MAG: hypothetical protein US60_C0014G0002 [Microgenomates group bacterium GW2011_GWC1_37_8]KKQ84395.1 MAG: hypothetical protein UT08_C0018G0001 [Candidatus Woesebacteria bacterium GW2011_GWB1_38_8]